jgi:hypothetical protein
LRHLFLDGCFNDVALTAHIMEKNLDAGPVIDALYFSSDEYKTLGELRNEMGALMPFFSYKCSNTIIV